MAHFALIGDDGRVEQVVVVDNTHLRDDDGVEQEALGVAYLHAIGLPGHWVQTSYTGSTRGQFAGIGATWDGEAFTTAPEIEEPTP